MQAYVCNYKEHWFTLRKIGHQWFNLNSVQSKPSFVTETYLSLYLKQLQQEGRISEFIFFSIKLNYTFTNRLFNFHCERHLAWMRGRLCASGEPTCYDKHTVCQCCRQDSNSKRRRRRRAETSPPDEFGRDWRATESMSHVLYLLVIDLFGVAFLIHKFW